MTFRPTLVVVSGAPGSGKTTLAHEIARSVGCPAVCRDEISEGMVHAALGFPPGPGDDLTMRTRPAFFGMLELLLTLGVTTVAEASFPDQVWRARLAPVLPLARIRVVHCTAAPWPPFDRVSLDAPWIEVDTTSGYRPGIDQVVSFVNGARPQPSLAASTFDFSR